MTNNFADQMIKIKEIESDLRCGIFENLEEMTEDAFDGTISELKYMFSGILRVLAEKSKQEHINERIDRFYESKDKTGLLQLINEWLLEYLIENKQDSKISSRITEYVQKHYKEDINVDMLAEVFHLAPNYLSSVFKKEYGENLGHYIQQIRMEKAKQLLENSFEKVNSISKAVGYWNVSYFCQSFRRYYGISPQQYRLNLIF